MGQDKSYRNGKAQWRSAGDLLFCEIAPITFYKKNDLTVKYRNHKAVFRAPLIFLLFQVR